MTNDTGVSDTDGITNNGTIAISDLEIGATYEFSRDNGASWIVLGTATETTATFDALAQIGTLDGNPDREQIGPGVAIYTSLSGSSSDTPDSFYFDVTMPSTLGSNDELLVESGATTRGVAIFVDGADLKITIGTGNGESDLTATGVFEPLNRYAIIVELLSDFSVRFYVAKKNNQLPISFGDPVASSAQALWAGDWSANDSSQWGAVTDESSIHGTGPNNYVSFRGTYHRGRFYKQKGFDDIWNDRSSLTLDSFTGTILARQSIVGVASNTSNPLPFTYDATAPIVTSEEVVGIGHNSGANQSVYTITADDHIGAISYAILISISVHER